MQMIPLAHFPLQNDPTAIFQTEETSNYLGEAFFFELFEVNAFNFREYIQNKSSFFSTIKI